MQTIAKSRGFAPLFPRWRALLALALVAASVPAACAQVPWPYNLRIDECRQTGSEFRIRTTGADLVLSQHCGEITFAQRIGERRPLGTLRLPAGELQGLRLVKQDADQVALQSGAGVRIEVHADSVVQMTAAHAISVAVEGVFAPEYLHGSTGALLALDERGGIGVYFWGGDPATVAATRQDGRFQVRQELTPERTFLLCVCPPRPYNWKQDHAERIVHFFPAIPGTRPTGESGRPLPTDEELAAWRKTANVLVLHLEAWQGFGVRHIKPKNPEQFRHVVRRAHELGYLVLPYSSCYYYGPAVDPAGRDPWKTTWRKDAVELYLDEARWLLEQYGVDGLYWDGHFTDPLKAWQCARRTRELLGTRRLYVHCTSDPLMRDGVYCPFVDTYADYILRGECKPRDRVVDPIYLRYEVSGYNISNTIGTLCYELCRVDKDVFDWALQSNARIPYWPGAQTVEGKDYFLHPDEARLYREYYLPALERIRGPGEYAPWAAAGRTVRAKRWEELADRQKVREDALARYLSDQRARMVGQQPENLALFRQARCSHYCDRREGPHDLGYPVQYAVDGNPDTYWAADFAPAWLEVDLGSVQSIGSVRVTPYCKDERYYHYLVQVSADGKLWQKVGEKADNRQARPEGDLYSFAPAPARYVRVTMLFNSKNCGLHITELGVYR